jgi:hypothetical protein
MIGVVLAAFAAFLAGVITLVAIWTRFEAQNLS